MSSWIKHNWKEVVSGGLIGVGLCGVALWIFSSHPTGLVIVGNWGDIAVGAAVGVFLCRVATWAWKGRR